jgi:hypothetical protein
MQPYYKSIDKLLAGVRINWSAYGWFNKIGLAQNKAGGFQCYWVLCRHLAIVALRVHCLQATCLPTYLQARLPRRVPHCPHTYRQDKNAPKRISEYDK